VPIEKYLTPPQGVREALRRGLELHEAGASGEGLQPETVAWARRMARGEQASRDKIVKMRAWHARHAVDKRPGWDSPPTPGYVAFLLWGGEPGRVWSNKVAAMIDREEGDKGMSDELEMKAKPVRFVSQAAGSLPINTERSWDGPAARNRMLDAAGIGGENPDFAQARRGFLVVDAANPELRGSYHLPFADIVDGELVALASGMRASASRLPQMMDLPQAVQDKARGVLDSYFAKLEKLRAGKSMTIKTAKISEADLATDEAGVFTGYASIFGNVDSHGDAVMPGAFRKSLSERGNVVPLLWQHDQAEPVGVIELVEDSKGLRVVRGEINLETARGREAYALLKQGAIKGLSIGFQTLKDGWSGKVRQLKELKLMEVSLVTFPANELATVTAVKNEDDAHRIRMAQVLTLIDAGMTNLMRAQALMEALVMEEPSYDTPPEGAAPEAPDMPDQDMPDGMDELAALLRSALKG
jgi:HK97 family phage prohead protease